jgi:undecaprenyl-phosphate 4-deoxy-4-formamido-L-arabinose transferase
MMPPEPTSVSHQGEAEPVQISVVVPAYNEEANLTELLERVAAAVEPLGTFEIIVVDDGSTDGTWPLLRAASERDPRVVGVRLQRNFGQHPAATAGFARARGDVVVTLDADLQNPPEEIPKLVARLGDDCDVAAGWRCPRRDKWRRKVPSRLFNMMVGRVTGVRLHDYGCMLRAYKRRVIRLLLQCPELPRSTSGLVAWLGVRIVEVPVEHRPRLRGRSRYGFWHLLRLSFDFLTGFSTGLLQAVSVGGIVISVLGFAAAVVLAVWRVMHGSGPMGLTTFVAILLFLAGVQVAVVGIVCEYIGRIYAQVQGRPHYVVADETRDPGDISEMGVR